MREHVATSSFRSPAFHPPALLASTVRVLHDVRAGVARLTVLSATAASVAGVVAFTGWAGVAAAGAALFGACVVRPRAEVWLVLTAGIVSPALAQVLVRWL